MGKRDTLTKSYLSENHVFADVVNYFLYQGGQVVQPEQLIAMDTTLLTVPAGIGSDEQALQRHRDVVKQITAKDDTDIRYSILGLELQSVQDATMPVRVMLYDAMQYDEQIKENKRRHQEKKEHGEGDEYLSGFHREDRLKPVITLVVYFGSDPWTAPRTLRELMVEMDEEMQRVLSDYELLLIVPAEMSDEKIMLLQTNLREVLLMLKYSKSKTQLKRVVQENESRFRKMERKAAMIVKEFTKWEFEVDEEDETVDVCEAVKEWAAEEQEIGRIQGIEQMAAKMLNEGFSVNMVVRITGLSVDEIEKLRKDQSHE